jgi:hypothetical protein
MRESDTAPGEEWTRQASSSERAFKRSADSLWRRVGREVDVEIREEAGVDGNQGVRHRRGGSAGKFCSKVSKSCYIQRRSSATVGSNVEGEEKR